MANQEGQKIQRTWSLDEKTAILAKVLASIFQKTDSQIIENIIAAKATRILEASAVIGYQFGVTPPLSSEELKNHNFVRKTVALTEETYANLKLIVDRANTRESQVVDDFVYETVITVNHHFPRLVDLTDNALAVKKGIAEENPGTEVLLEIFTGQLTEKTISELRESVAKLKQTYHRR